MASTAGKVLVRALVLLLAACAPDSGPPNTENVGEPASPATPEGGALASAPAPPTSPPPDPLGKAAFDAQQALLGSNTAEVEAIATEGAVRAAIHGRINFTFREAVVDLRSAGVEFDQAEAAVNILNVHRRQQGVFELQTIFQDSSDQFRIVDDFMPSEPFGVVLLRGTSHPQSFRGWIRGEILDANGEIAQTCRVAISSEPERLLGCRAVILGLEDRALINLAKAHLTSELQ